MDSEGDTIPEGSFRDGDQEVYISLYHVQQDTLGVLTPTLVLTENMTMIDVLDNLIGSASDLPDPTKTVTKNIEQINSDLIQLNDRVDAHGVGSTVTLTRGTPYYPTSDGYFSLECSYYAGDHNNVYATAYVNNYLAIDITPDNSNSIKHTIFVKKGSALTYGYNGSALDNKVRAYFVPLV
jgi:hypothetical protein